MKRLRDVVLGLAFFAFLAAFVAASVLVYTKAFADTTDVTLTASSLGNAIQTGSDVKLRGVPVGTVTKVSPDQDGSRLDLALDPDVAAKLPPDTSALLLPKTLFGERYVALQTPPVLGSGGASVSAADVGLETGDEIRQDTSAEAVELQQVFDDMLPVLETLEPEKLQATLSAMAELLRGQGAEIGDQMDGWADYMKKLNPLVPQMSDNFGRLGRVAEQYAEATPDLLDALDTMTISSRTISEQSDNLEQVFSNVIAAGDTSTGWMTANSGTINILSRQSRRALAAVRPYATEFPCLFKAARDFIPAMEKTLGKGTNEPGMHVVLNVVPSRGKYGPGDRPTHTGRQAPRCPYQTGQVGTRPAPSAPQRISAPPGQSLEQRVVAATSGLGDANSPAENQLVAELMAPDADMTPSEYPDWGSLLLGPVLRDAEVELR